MKNKKVPLVSVEGVAEKPQIAKKKYKTTYDSITNPKAGDKECTYALYLSEAAFRFFPDKDKWRERLIVSLYEWAFKEDSYEMMGFCMQNAIPRSTLADWCSKYDDIAKAYNEAKLILATRRRTGALTRKLDKDVVFRDIHRYDPEWLEIDKYHADLKKNETNTDRNITVVIPQMPSVDTVKTKGE